MNLRRLLMICLLAVAVGLATGCAGSRSEGGEGWLGLKKPAAVTADRWSYNRQPGQVLRTQHYLIYTTITDAKVLKRLPQVMEGGYAQYQMFAAAPSDVQRPMNCFIFAHHDQWADFTSRHTGKDAAVYLQITRGGYTIGDWFVSYFVGSNSTYSVAAHEGWHQYVARHFKAHLPPFLEEGTACMFESVRFVDDLPQWDLSVNPNRALGLRYAIEDKKLWPLKKLVTMHAGNVVGLPGDRIEAFYSQDWAFARFLWQYNDGQYRPAFKQLLADTEAGHPYDPTGTIHPARYWSPAGVQPMLEHYLGKPLDQIEVEYLKFAHHIAYDQLGRQWTAAPK